MPWRVSLFTEYWLILGRGFEESICILMGGALGILKISVEDFAHKEGGSWSIRDKWLVSLELALVLPETEQIKDVKGSTDSPSQLFWLLLNSRIISFF